MSCMFYFASCVNIIFNKLRQQRVKYDVDVDVRITRCWRSLLNMMFVQLAK